MRACLEGMGDFDDEETAVGSVVERGCELFLFFLFLKFVLTKPSVASGSSETDYVPSLYEQFLDPTNLHVQRAVEWGEVP